ncbi:RNA-directed DNA polymerase, eukaryota [Tanacetum coccineum]|uniref:RNA-directed DNA polymerase, eukaryota n=1 Tax=Tanacetum coccineum TaxID=301880 RepID=A0ABQ5ICE9_9ASTR
MGMYRSKEDELAKLSSSFFVTNFPDKFSAKELWTDDVYLLRHVQDVSQDDELSNEVHLMKMEDCVITPIVEGRVREKEDALGYLILVFSKLDWRLLIIMGVFNEVRKQDERHSRFNKPPDYRLHIDLDFPNKLSLKQQMVLEIEVTREEIKKAGLGIEIDVVEVVLYFFNHGQFPKAREDYGGITPFDSKVRWRLVSLERWICDLSGDGEFRVKEVRNFIDDLFLPSHPEVTRWVKCIPKKINIFVWRARRDCLPTRQNLIRRGVVLESDVCPLCEDSVEESQHVFFQCSIAQCVIYRICRWWDLGWAADLGVVYRIGKRGFSLSIRLHL